MFQSSSHDFFLQIRQIAFHDVNLATKQKMRSDSKQFEDAD